MAAIGGIGWAIPRPGAAQADRFNEIWATLQSDPALIDQAITFRDFALEDDGVTCINVVNDGTTTCMVSAARRPPRLAPSELKISRAAQDLIIYYEVTNKAKYDRELEKPIWPGGESGVTVGFGYDLGYVSRADFQAEWKDLIHPFAIETLASVCGLKGPNAQRSLDSVTRVRIDWDAANKQFSTVLLPIFVAQTEKFLPNLSTLHEDCRGALVSLVFNRGTATSLNNDTRDTRREMRDIKALMAAQSFKEIPQKLRDMTWIWKDNPRARGVALRREAEAALFERGLSA
ncbi:hypothetical protein [Rhizobium sp. SAFR-030]|uniref:hypothetical protein n=1 Tax=Rhizobium sp. SAFR-030 TaxID=3387277 RepID=UPI003F7CDE03